jgi:zinc and cadmium transporter
MSTLSYILLYTFLGSIAALLGGLVLLYKEKLMLKISHFLSSFAAGTLLGTAFFELLPEAVHKSEELGTDEHLLFIWPLLGILAFFLIERSIHWFHHHVDHPGHLQEKQTTVPLIIISDTVHNFIDGVVIAATFLVNIPLGIVTTLAVIAHEVPQEIGDFGLLLHKGMKKKKIIIVNILSAAAAFAGAIISYIAGDSIELFIPAMLGLTAGFFIYIAVSDIIPEIHNEKRKGYAFIESLLLILGVITIYTLLSLIQHGH